MNETGFTHILAVLLLFSRIGDVVSTRLATPTLRLETNAIARRLGWPFAAATLLVALVPYYSPPMGVALLAASLLVTGSNLSRGWVAHVLGEADFEEILLRAARRGRRRVVLGFVLAGAAHVMFAGLLLMWLSGSVGWSYWFGMGMLGYGLVMSVHGSLFVLRLFRRAFPSAV
jgi:hypothetical protein